jgi:carbamoylphosphate synthase large subunit
MKSVGEVLSITHTFEEMVKHSHPPLGVSLMTIAAWDSGCNNITIQIDCELQGFDPIK